jgi:hypothetical protein
MVGDLPQWEPISLPQGSGGEDLAEWVCPDKPEWIFVILISLKYPLQIFPMWDINLKC